MLPPSQGPCRKEELMREAIRRVTGIRHLYAMAEIARLKRNADWELRVVSVPDDRWRPSPGTFRSKR
jgi:hypothetical protein